jgi:hypothetical protein
MSIVSRIPAVPDGDEFVVPVKKYGDIGLEIDRLLDEARYPV